jgi:hypothetical protein
MVAVSFRNSSLGTAISFCSRPRVTIPCTAENRLRVCPVASDVRTARATVRYFLAQFPTAYSLLLSLFQLAGFAT